MPTPIQTIIHYNEQTMQAGPNETKYKEFVQYIGIQMIYRESFCKNSWVDVWENEKLFLEMYQTCIHTESKTKHVNASFPLRVGDSLLLEKDLPQTKVAEVYFDVTNHTWVVTCDDVLKTVLDVDQEVMDRYKARFEHDFKAHQQKLEAPKPKKKKKLGIF